MVPFWFGRIGSPFAHVGVELTDSPYVAVPMRIMTGMGADGRDGAAWIKAKGGAILTEAESSCIVYGMPRSVVEAGLSDMMVPLEAIARAIVEHL